MANSLTSNGLTIGTLNNTITEFIDPNNSKMVIGDNANISKKFEIPSPVSTTDTSTTTFTLPSLNVGSIGTSVRIIGKDSPIGGDPGGTVTIKLPASGTYAYVVKNFSPTLGESYPSFTLSMNVLTATRGSGGATVGSATSTHHYYFAGIAVLYYRLK